MAQFQVYRNPRPGSDLVPYLLDVQSDLVDTGSRVVVPLIPLARHGPLYSRLNPVFSIEAREVVMATPDLAAVDDRDLRDPVVSLREAHFEIIAAIDFLLSRY